MLEGAGYEIVPFQEAQIYHQYLHRDNIADRKSRQMLHRASEDESGGGRCGGRLLCAGAGSKKRISIHVSISIGNNKETGSAVYFDRICVRSDAKCQGKTDFIYRIIHMNMRSDRTKTRTYAGISADGCNRLLLPHYSLCERAAQPPSESAGRKRVLRQNGYREVVLTGIHRVSTGSISTRRRGFELIRAVHAVEGIERILGPVHWSHSALHAICLSCRKYNRIFICPAADAMRH